MKQDYTTLNNPKFIYFAELHHPLPAWVANEATPSGEAFEKCASVAFADTQRRLLPIKDKLSTFHSALNLFADMESFQPDVFDRVKSACAFFGIEADVAPYADLFADRMEKSASVAPEGRYAIDQEMNGERYKLLPLNDANDVRDSAYELSKMASERRIHFLTLVPAAIAVVKAAADLGVSNLPRLIERFGAERCPDLAKAATLLEGREHLSKTVDKDFLRASYAEAIKEAQDGIITPDLCMKKIAAIDDAAGITPKFNMASPVVPASEIVFCGPLVSEVEKVAAENVAVKEVLVPLADFKKLDLIECEFKLSKEASHVLKHTIDTADAKDISLAVMDWTDRDQRTLLRMLAEV